MTPLFLKGLKMAKDLKSIGPIDLLGAALGVGKTGCSVLGDGLDYVKNFASSAVSENKLEQATEHILKYAECINKIKTALNCSAVEAEELLEKQLNKME